MRIVVLGGAGNFGARIVRALRAEPGVELFAAGRRLAPVSGAEDVPVLVLDVDAPDFAARLRAASPDLVINCVGPFQGRDYRVARATLASAAHYIDLADGRKFVADFAAALNQQAAAAGRVAITGASTLPALSCAVVEHLGEGLASLESIEVTIAPGQLAPRGAATLAAAFSYLGRSFPVWRGGRWRQGWGWMDLRRVRLDVGARLAAACDVPDLALFPHRFAGVQTVRFQAALEFSIQNLVLWCLAGLRRVGLPFPVSRWAVGLDRLAGPFDAIAANAGGMRVSIVGRMDDARVLRRTWQLVAPARHGPEIPCMAAILLARRLAGGDVPAPGASACMGFLALSAFEALFVHWDIRTRVEQIAL